MRVEHVYLYAIDVELFKGVAGGLQLPRCEDRLPGLPPAQFPPISRPWGHN
jgi:hypothetical protein